MEQPVYLLNPYQSMVVSKQGIRPSNEDTHTLNEIDGCYVYAVYDGHAGKSVSDLLSKVLPKSLVQIVKRFNKVIDIKNAIKQLFLDIDTALCTDCIKNKLVSGSTALICVKYFDILVVTNLGDCRAVIFSDKSNILFETEDHKPGTVKELQRITSCGGKVINIQGINRANGNLSVSRSIGDFLPIQFGSKTKIENKKCIYTGVNSVISPIPDVNVLNLQKLPTEQKWYLLLACDGLWDVISTIDAVTFINHHNDKAVGASLLVDFALTRSQDNITCICSALSLQN